jgi:hypothetical protein
VRHINSHQAIFLKKMELHINIISLLHPHGMKEQKKKLHTNGPRKRHRLQFYHVSEIANPTKGLINLIQTNPNQEDLKATPI